MKKVIYSVLRLGKSENKKITGIGYLADGQLVTAAVSKAGKPYVRTYDCEKACHPVPNTQDEFKGAYYEIVEYESRDIEVNYYIWYKLVK